MGTAITILPIPLTCSPPNEHTRGKDTLILNAKQKALQEVLKKLEEASNSYYEAVCEHDIHECALGEILGNIVAKIDIIVDTYNKGQ